MIGIGIRIGEDRIMSILIDKFIGDKEKGCKKIEDR